MQRGQAIPVQRLKNVSARHTKNTEAAAELQVSIAAYWKMCRRCGVPSASDRHKAAQFLRRLEALDLRARGIQYRMIARILDVAAATAWAWSNEKPASQSHLG